MTVPANYGTEYRLVYICGRVVLGAGSFGDGYLAPATQKGVALYIPYLSPSKRRAETVFSLHCIQCTVYS